MSYFVHPKALVDTKDIGEGTRIWAFAQVMEGSRVGADCNICGHSFIEKGAILGNNVTVKNGISIWEKVIVEDNVFLGPNMVFTNVVRPRSGVRGNFKETVVKKGATIGANATVVCGITIGQYAFVGAGAVVTKDVKPYSLVTGSPARHKGYVCECAEKLGFEGVVGICSNCGRKYKLQDGNLIPEEQIGVDSRSCS